MTPDIIDDAARGSRRGRAEGRVVSRYDQPLWCDECGVSLDLHDGPDSCKWAERRAEAIARAEWALFQGILR